MSESFNLITNATFDTNTNSYKIITSDITKDLKIGLGTYIIKGIEKEKPISFRVLNNKNIKFHGLSNNLFTGNLKSPTNDQKRYHYYYGNISLEVLDNFGSIEGYYFVKKNTNNGLYTVETKNHKLVFDNNNTNGVNTKNYLELSEIDERKNNNFTYFGNNENGKSVKGFDTISSENITYYSYITTIFDPEYSKHMCIRSNSIPNYTSYSVDSVENIVEIDDWETITNQKGYDKQNFGYYNNGNRILGKSFKIPINPIITDKKNIPSNILDSSMTGINSESFWFKNNQYWKEIMIDRNYENLNLSGDKNNTQNFPNSLTPLGPIGIAVNGIPFYNHFKMTDIVTNNNYIENYNSNSISADRILTLSELTFSRVDLVLSSNYDNYGGTIDINNNYYYNKYPVGLEAKIKLETVRNKSYNSTLYDLVFKDTNSYNDIYIYGGESSKVFYFNISEDGFKDYKFKITNLEGTSVLEEKLKRINNSLEVIGIPGETYSSTLLLEIDNSKLFTEEDTSTELEYLLQGINNRLFFYDFVQGEKDKRIGDYENISTSTDGSGIGLTVSFTVAPGIKGISVGNGNKTNGDFNNVEVLAPLGFNYDSNTGMYSESRNGSGLKILYRVKNNKIKEDTIVITDVGSGYVLGETLIIQDELGHNDTTFKLTSEEGIIVENSIVIENIGIGYQVNDTITISNEETKGTANTKFKISDTGYIDINLHILKESTDTNANKSKDYIYLKKHGTLITSENNLRDSIFEGGISQITNGNYTNLSTTTTTDGFGSGAELTIVVDTGSVNKNEGTITVTNVGQNYKVGDSLTVTVESKSLKFILTENNFIVDGIKKYNTPSFGNLTDYTGFLKNIDSNSGDIKKFMDYMKSIGGAQGHSPILGWAFDGFPIYGQIGFNNDTNTTLKFFKSSYVNGKYKEGEGDLDFCNGIIKKTPEFPQGIYHYVCTLKIDNNNELDYSVDSLYQYPYVIGAYKAIPDINNFLTPTVISQSSTTYDTSTVENESSLIITNTKNYDINFRSLKGNEDFYNGSSASSVILSQDENTIYIQNSSKPYIWNFTGNRTILDERFGIDNSNFGDSVNNLTSNSNSVFKGYGNIAKFKYKPINTITKNNLNSLQDKIYTDFNTTSSNEGVDLTVNFEINNNDIKDEQITIAKAGTGYVHNEVITITIETGKTITFKLNVMLGQVVKFSNNENLSVEKNVDNSILSLGIVMKEDLVNEYCYVITEGFAEVSIVNYNQQETLSLNNSLSFDNEGNIEKYKIDDDLADNSKKCIIGTYVGKNNKNTIRNHLIKVNIHLIEG